MPRPKKNGEKISLFLNKDLIDKLREDADKKGQTLTVALERSIDLYLDSQKEKCDNGIE